MGFTTSETFAENCRIAALPRPHPTKYRRLESGSDGKAAAAARHLRPPSLGNAESSMDNYRGLPGFMATTIAGGDERS